MEEQGPSTRVLDVSVSSGMGGTAASPACPCKVISLPFYSFVADTTRAAHPNLGLQSTQYPCLGMRQESGTDLTMCPTELPAPGVIPTAQQLPHRRAVKYGDNSPDDPSI